MKKEQYVTIATLLGSFLSVVALTWYSLSSRSDSGGIQRAIESANIQPRRNESYAPELDNKDFLDSIVETTVETDSSDPLIVSNKSEEIQGQGAKQTYILEKYVGRVASLKDQSGVLHSCELLAEDKTLSVIFGTKVHPLTYSGRIIDFGVTSLNDDPLIYISTLENTDFSVHLVDLTALLDKNKVSERFASEASYSDGHGEARFFENNGTPYIIYATSSIKTEGNLQNTRVWIEQLGSYQGRYSRNSGVVVASLRNYLIGYEQSDLLGHIAGAHFTDDTISVEMQTQSGTSAVIDFSVIPTRTGGILIKPK